MRGVRVIFWGVLIASPAAAPKAVLAESPPGPKAGVVVHGQAPWTANKTRRNVAEALGRTGYTLDARAEGLLFFTPPPPSAVDALTETNDLLNAAKSALGSFAVPEARKNLTAAEKRMEPWIGLPVARKFDMRRLQLEVALAHLERDEAALQTSLGQYATRYPQHRPDQNIWPPDLLAKLDSRARMAVTQLAVDAKPQADVYLDGEKVGRTPLEIPGVTIGRHRVEVRAKGHFPADSWITLEPAKAGRLDMRLPSDLARTLSDAKDLSDSLKVRLHRAALGAGFKTLVLVQPMPNKTVELRLAQVTATGLEVSDARTTGTDAKSIEAEIVALQGGLLVSGGGGSSASRLPWIGAAAGAALVGVGVGLRVWANSSAQEFDQRQGALTQVDAFELRDTTNTRANAGTAVMSVGGAAALGFAGWAIYELIGAD